MAVETNVLKASIRAAGSKGAARVVRRAGLVPAIAYGNGVQDIVIAVQPTELEAVLRTDFGFNAKFNLEVEGQGTHQVMVRDIQFCSVKRVVTHVDFKVVTDDETIKLEIPVVTEGRSRGVAAGGRLELVRRTVTVVTTVGAIPVAITYDVTKMKIGDIVYIDEIKAPEGCKFLFNHRFPVVRVARRRAAKEEDVAEDVEDDAEEASAEESAE